MPGAIAGDPDTAFRPSAGRHDQHGVHAEPTASTPQGVLPRGLVQATTTTGRQDHRLGQPSRPAPTAAAPTAMIYLGQHRQGHLRGLPRRRTDDQLDRRYNDGQWHHVVATLGRDGHEALRRRRSVVSRSTGITRRRPYSGYWRVGGDIMGGWPDNAAATSTSTGTIDEAAVYNHVLTPAQVAAPLRRTGPTPHRPRRSPSTTSDLDRRVRRRRIHRPRRHDRLLRLGLRRRDQRHRGPPTTRYAAPRHLQVTLTVTDDDGATGTVTTTSPSTSRTSRRRPASPICETS